MWFGVLLELGVLWGTVVVRFIAIKKRVAVSDSMEQVKIKI